MDHDNGVRPIFDPDLSSGTTARLRRASDRLYPADGPPARWLTSRTARYAAMAAPPLATVGLVLLSLYSGVAALVLFFLLAVSIACVVHVVLTDDLDFDDLFSTLLLTPLAAIPLFLLAWLVEIGLAAAGLPPGGGIGAEDGSLSALRVPVAVLLALSGTAGTWGLFHAARPTMLASEHHGRYFTGKEFGGCSNSPETEVMLSVQQAVDHAQEAIEVLGASFDGTTALTLLRDQEWRVAQDLARHRKHRLSLEERHHAAVSDRVREALRPQEEAVRVSWEAVTERVDAIVRYGRSAHEAVVAHREWEQCEEIARSNDSYADLVVSSVYGTLDTEALGTDAARAEAARQVRDERVREAMRAGQWLADALE